MADMSSFQAPHKKVYQGRGLVILKSNGTPSKIILKAHAKSLVSSLVEVKTK
ncbi:hypothetical protein D3C84_1246870 [compost metagenome]